MALIVLAAAVVSTLAEDAVIRQATPTANEVAALREAERGCGLTKETLTFEPNQVGEYDIRINRQRPVSEDRITCALDRLPPDFEMKFGVGPLLAKAVEQPSD
jgi:hypothetical protein